ncbi:VWA domain-containing protein [Azotobacter beijerinckii]|nr:VWA domain-containing protein [Azotobacter beijerinckii]
MGSLPVYAQHLSEQTGVKVVVEGSQTYTDGTKVVVPFTETDPELSFGYVAHECSHVRNTDMQYFGEAQAVPFRLSVLNILEDIRIERMSMDQYPGTEGDLNHLAKAVLGDRLDPADVAQKPALHVVHDTLLLAGRRQMLGQDLEQPATVMLQAQEKLLGAQLSARIMQKVGEVLQCDSTREVLALADAIIALLPSQEDQQDEGGAEQQEQPPQENSQENSGGGQGDQQDQEQPENQPQEGDDASASEADSDEGESESQSQGEEAGQPDSEQKNSAGNQAGDGQDDRQDGGSSRSQGGDTPAEAEGDDAAGDSGSQPGDHPSQEANDLREQAMQATAGDLHGLISEVGDKAAELLSQKARRDPCARRLLSLAGRSCLRSDAASERRVQLGLEQSSGLRQCLNGLLQAQVDCRVSLKRQGKRLDTSRIALLKAGETRVFRSKARAERQSAAIQFLLDKSGSMRAAMDEAEAALYAVLQAVENLPLVSTGALAFPERGVDDVTRCALIKGHKERLHQAVRLGGFGAMHQGCTPLGEALWPAAVELLRAKGERKILFVITDGEPDSAWLAQEMVERCENTGIEVIALGFGGATADLLSRTFTRFRAVGQVSRLKQALFELVREVLVA